MRSECLVQGGTLPTEEWLLVSDRKMRHGDTKAAVKQVKGEVVTSRDRHLQRQEFTRLFSRQGEIALEGFDPPARALWKRLDLVAGILRQKPGKSIAELAKTTGLSESQIQFCIRTLIDIGGEIEITTEGELRGGRFFLHN